MTAWDVFYASRLFLMLAVARTFGETGSTDCDISQDGLDNNILNSLYLHLSNKSELMSLLCCVAKLPLHMPNRRPLPPILDSQ